MGSSETGHDLGQGNLLFYAPEYIAKKTKKPYISLIHKVFYSFLLLLSKKPGAENGTRTRDLNLGKVALYQLSYFRKMLPATPFGAFCECKDKPKFLFCKIFPQKKIAGRPTPHSSKTVPMHKPYGNY